MDHASANAILDWALEFGLKHTRVQAHNGEMGVEQNSPGAMGVDSSKLAHFFTLGFWGIGKKSQVQDAMIVWQFHMCRYVGWLIRLNVDELIDTVFPPAIHRIPVNVTAAKNEVNTRKLQELGLEYFQVLLGMDGFPVPVGTYLGSIGRLKGASLDSNSY